MKIRKGTIKEFLKQYRAAVVVPGLDDQTMIIGGSFWLLQIPRNESLIKWFKQAKAKSQEPGKAKWPVDVEMYFDGQPDPGQDYDRSHIYREAFERFMRQTKRYRAGIDKAALANWMARPTTRLDEGQYIPLFPEVDEAGNPTATFVNLVPLQLLCELMDEAAEAILYNDGEYDPVTVTIIQSGESAEVMAEFVIMPASVNRICDPVRDWIINNGSEGE